MADQQYSPRDGEAFDVVLIGGGTGGYVAAIRAAQLGLDAVVVETDKLGGTCLHRGCIPTKAFLKSADVYEEVQHSAEFGVDIAGDVAFNYPAALDRSNKVVNGQYKGLLYLFDKKYKIPVIPGFGSIAGPGQVQVAPADGGTPFTLATRNIIIDTGTRPRAIKDLPFDGKRVINSDDAVVLETLPQSFIIRGGGAVGVEWASIYGRYGSKVSLVGRVVPAEDEEAAAVLIRAFKRQGIAVFPASRPTADDIDVTKSGVRMRVKDDRGKEEVVEAEVLLVAIGRQGNIEDIGLEKVGVATRGRADSGRRHDADQCAEHLCHRRRQWPADARPHGYAHGGHRHRAHRRTKALPTRRPELTDGDVLPTGNRQRGIDGKASR